ncbi:MAG: Rne/Rng family ribonuclease [Acidobacteriota bacterium]|jgi:ribonuclease G|nr:Rne/Rng family ribonuclease [Acidobacteriota bacterium]
MIKDMIVSNTALETRVAILEDDQLAELYIERHRSRGILANTYKGKVTKVLPGMQSAFVNIGLEKDAFLYVSDFVEENDEIDTDLPHDDDSMEIAAEVEHHVAEARPPRREKDRERKGEKSRWRERKERAEAARADEVNASGEERSDVSEIPEAAEFPVDAQADETQFHETPFDSVSPETEEISSDISDAYGISGSFGKMEAYGGRQEAVAENAALPGKTPADAGGERIAADIPEFSDAAQIYAAQKESESSADEIDANESVSGDSFVLDAPGVPASAETAENTEQVSAEAEIDLPSAQSDIEAPGNSESKISEPRRKSAAIRDDGEQMPFSGDNGERGGFSRRRGATTRRKRYTAVRHTPQRPLPERHSIDDMLREGQEVLVQVAKEPIGKKGARVTSHIALPGRYLVYMPTVDHVGVSRKIGSDAERMRLKEIILRHREQFPGGIIVRTAAAEHSEEDLVNDLRFLLRIWEDMRSRADRVSAPALIHAEMSLVQRLLRDQFSFEFASIRVDDEYEYQRIVEFVDKIYPNLVHRVKLYTKENDIFDEYGITNEIDKLIHPKIWLKSGGYIVINQTEALVSIDINTGKFVGRGNNSLEETITRTNLEAVKEIVRQIRLRDLGGIIVIDFIDMDERKNRKRVMEALSEEIARDKAPSKILEFNEFGLVAITRKRVKQSLERTLCQPCPYCYGSGMVKSVSTTCHNIFHEVEKMRGIIDNRMELTVRVHPDVARALRETESGVIEELRHILRRDIIVKADPALHIEHFNIVT